MKDLGTPSRIEDGTANHADKGGSLLKAWINFSLISLGLGVSEVLQN